MAAQLGAAIYHFALIMALLIVALGVGALFSDGLSQGAAVFGRALVAWGIGRIALYVLAGE